MSITISILIVVFFSLITGKISLNLNTDNLNYETNLNINSEQTINNQDEITKNTQYNIEISETEEVNSEALEEQLDWALKIPKINLYARN